MTNDKFFVELPSYSNDNTGFYKRTLINKIQKDYPWLTLAGLDDPYYTNKGNKINGVQDAGPGNIMTFGTAKYHDVNWVRRATYATEKGYVPILNPVTNWNTVANKLHTFAMNRKPRIVERYNTASDFRSLGNDRFVIAGHNITITDDFVYVGAKALPRKVTPTYYYSLPDTTKKTLAGIMIVVERI